MTSTSRIAVSSWSLDRTLGSPRDGAPTTPGLPLLELPAALRTHGYDTVQLCHFHLPRTDTAYLQQLRRALEGSGVHLDAFLVDDGDLTDPATGAGWTEWVARWVEVGEQLGATRVRLIAGKTRHATAHQDSSHALREFARTTMSTRIVTENWFDLTRTADDVEAILGPIHPEVGLLLDLGNWTMPDRDQQLARIAHYGETCHAKAHWRHDTVNEADYRGAIGAVLHAGYTGPFALVYDADDPDEWAGLATLRTIVADEIKTLPATQGQEHNSVR